MPTTQKTLLFLSGFVTSLGSVVVICSILGTQAWVTSTIFFTDAISNGTIVITYGLFRGTSAQDLNEGLQDLDKNFEVLGILGNSSQKSLHLVAIIFLILSLGASVLSSVFTFYNSISNPYQTFLGPMGVYTWNGLSASFVFLTMLLFVGNTESNHLSEELSQKLYPDTVNERTTHTYGYSFWLILLVILLNIVTVVIIIFYQKARYQQKQEQRKPVEYAPRDGILF
ncbi:clarin-3 [Peromyscus californicus insignis]|uniref:clarin-3 n=1 Tax=Peromyscus californicus insignis TaxID=564181 RepID=UPI0022A6B363|nr:clarin-3 [Peromyscus californicus insignis]